MEPVWLARRHIAMVRLHKQQIYVRFQSLCTDCFRHLVFHCAFPPRRPLGQLLAFGQPPASKKRSHNGSEKRSEKQSETLKEKLSEKLSGKLSEKTSEKNISASENCVKNS